MRNCTLTGNQLFQDILSYDLPLIGCSESSSDEDVGVATGAQYILQIQCFLEQLSESWTFHLELKHNVSPVL